MYLDDDRRHLQRRRGILAGRGRHLPQARDAGVAFGGGVGQGKVGGRWDQDGAQCSRGLRERQVLQGMVLHHLGTFDGRVVDGVGDDVQMAHVARVVPPCVQQRVAGVVRVEHGVEQVGRRRCRLEQPTVVVDGRGQIKLFAHGRDGLRHQPMQGVVQFVVETVL